MKQIARLILSRYAVITAFVWSFLEAIIFFILPDFFIAPAIIRKKENAWPMVMAASIGTLLGSLVLVILVGIFGEKILQIILSLPFTTNEMFVTVQDKTSSVLAVFLQPFSGIPSKVWVYSAASQQVNLWVFVMVLTAGRIFRFSLVAWVTLLVEKFFGKGLRKHWAICTCIYLALFFISLYAISY